MIDVVRLSSDVAAVLESEDVLVRWRGIHLYMGEIRAEIGDVLGVLDDCKELLDKQPEYLYEDFKGDWRAGCIDNSYCVLACLPCERVDDYIENRNTRDICIDKNGFEIHIKGYPLFPLCRRIWDYIPIEERGEDKYDEYIAFYGQENDNRFIRYAFLVFLYWALKNERERNTKKAYIEGVALPPMDEAAPVPPAVEEKVPAAGATTSAKRNAAREKEDNILTPAARKHFKDAIGYKYMRRRKDGGYQWLYDEKKVALAFFLVRAYYPNTPPWTTLASLFFIGEKAVGNLKGSCKEMKKTNYWMARFGNEVEKRGNKDAPSPPWFTEFCDFFGC